jgi:hypothetical protein
MAVLTLFLLALSPTDARKHQVNECNGDFSSVISPELHQQR